MTEEQWKVILIFLNKFDNTLGEIEQHLRVIRGNK